MNVNDVLKHTNWVELAWQKLGLLHAIDAIENYPEPVREGDPLDGAVGHLTGILHWIDAIQEAAEASGFPVAYLSVPEEGDPGYDPDHEGRVVLVNTDGDLIKEESNA